MIIPTAEYDPLFADDGVPFRDKMLNYIEREFGDVLGPRKRLLQSDDGVDALAEFYAKSYAMQSVTLARPNQAA